MKGDLARNLVIGEVRTAEGPDLVGGKGLAGARLDRRVDTLAPVVVGHAKHGGVLDLGMTVERVLAELRDAGLDSMPGGGAEIFAKATRDKIIRGKADGPQWLDVMRQAHKMGIPTNATMLSGHIESVEDRVDHLLPPPHHELVVRAAPELPLRGRQGGVGHWPRRGLIGIGGWR